jgi:hypothetical protein
VVSCKLLEADSEATPLNILFLSVLGCTVRIRCQGAEARSLLATNYKLTRGHSEVVDLDYVVGRQRGTSAFFLKKGTEALRTAADASEFLFFFEEDLTLELQKLRCDLYFLHAAALESAGKAYLLVAPAGSGKSTTTWALLHHGFGYLSDELGPVDLKTLEVHPYPHALCLKDEPPAAYPLPARVLRTVRTLHIPPGNLPSGVSAGPFPLAAIFFLQYSPEARGPMVQLLSKAEAGARLFANALNQLAHLGEGLDGAIKIAVASACFKLTTADLPLTCQLVQTTIEGLFGG